MPTFIAGASIPTTLDTVELKAMSKPKANGRRATFDVWTHILNALV